MDNALIQAMLAGGVLSHANGPNSMTEYGASVVSPISPPSLSPKGPTCLIWRRPTLARSVRLFEIQIGLVQEPKAMAVALRGHDWLPFVFGEECFK